MLRSYQRLPLLALVLNLSLSLAFVEGAKFDIRRFKYLTRILICQDDKYIREPGPDSAYNETYHVSMTNHIISNIKATTSSTKLNLIRLGKVSMPDFFPDKIITLPASSVLCQARVNFSDPEVQKQISQLNELADNFVNIIFSPATFTRSDTQLFGDATCSGAFVETTNRALECRTMVKNCIFVSTEAWAIGKDIMLTNVALHEIGHSYRDGKAISVHDSYPESIENGTFISHKSAINFYGSNYFRYSPQEIRRMEKYCNNRLDKNIQKPSWQYAEIYLKPTCGNRIVEAGEQCETLDGLPSSLCDKDCRFTSGVECSITDVGCDSNGRIVPEGRLVWGESPKFCRQGTYSDGTARGTLSKLAPTNSTCGLSKKCTFDGFCRSVCPWDSEPCACLDTWECSMCCRDKESGVCQPEMKKENDELCTDGACFEGQCLAPRTKPLPTTWPDIPTIDEIGFTTEVDVLLPVTTTPLPTTWPSIDEIGSTTEIDFELPVTTTPLPTTWPDIPTFDEIAPTTEIDDELPVITTSFPTTWSNIPTFDEIDPTTEIDDELLVTTTPFPTTWPYNPTMTNGQIAVSTEMDDVEHPVDICFQYEDGYKRLFCKYKWEFLFSVFVLISAIVLVCVYYFFYKNRPEFSEDDLEAGHCPAARLTALYLVEGDNIRLTSDRN